MAERWSVSAGDVVEVQLTHETYVTETPGARRAGRNASVRQRSIERLRVFLREGDGKDRKYDFEGVGIGVRAAQRVAVVRAKTRGAREPVNLVLCNLSTGEREVFESAVSAFLMRKPMFGPTWKALGASAIAWLVGAGALKFFIAPTSTLDEAGVYAAFLAALSIPVFWGVFKLWDGMTAQGRYRRARADFIDEVESRVRAYAPPMPA